MTTKVAVIGAEGRMGATACEAVEGADDLELVGRFDEGDDLGGANVQSGGDHANRPIGTEADRGQGPETRAANRDEVRGQG